MIVSCCNFNEYYFRQLKVMLYSLSVNSPNDRAKVFLVDFPNGEVDKLKSYFGNYIFVNRNLGVTNTDDAADFMVSYRSIVVLETFDEYKETIAWFDNDLIIRKPLDDFWKDITPNSLKVLVRETDDVTCIFQCGVFAVGYSEATRRYLVDYNDAVQKERKWIGEQRELYLQFKKHENDINLVPMNITYNDVGDRKKKCFNAESHIWHSKSKHFTKKKFRKAFNWCYKQYEKKSR